VKGDKGQVWPADKNEDDIAVAGQPRKSPKVVIEAPAADADGVTQASGSPALAALLADLIRSKQADTSAGDATAAEGGWNTAGLDALFATMARDRGVPEASGSSATAEDGTPQSLPAPDGKISADPARPENTGLEASRARTLLGSFAVGLSALVVGPLAFVGLHRASRRARPVAALKRPKQHVDKSLR
jgi:hypothetical protein